MIVYRGWRYWLARLLGARFGVAHNPVILDRWLAGTMEKPYIVDRDGNRLG